MAVARVRPPQKPFETLEQAQAWVADFVDWCNHEHRHSGIRFVTPSERHFGRERPRSSGGPGAAISLAGARILRASAVISRAGARISGASAAISPRGACHPGRGSRRPKRSYVSSIVTCERVVGAMVFRVNLRA